MQIQAKTESLTSGFAKLEAQASRRFTNKPWRTLGFRLALGMACADLFLTKGGIYRSLPKQDPLYYDYPNML